MENKCRKIKTNCTGQYIASLNLGAHLPVVGKTTATGVFAGSSCFALKWYSLKGQKFYYLFLLNLALK